MHTAASQTGFYPGILEGFKKTPGSMAEKIRGLGVMIFFKQALYIRHLGPSLYSGLNGTVYRAAWASPTACFSMFSAKMP